MIDDLDRSYDREQLADICRRYHVARLELFGSRATGQAHTESDYDLLVTYQEGHRPGIDFFALADELEALLHKPVDLLTRRKVELDRNPYFKRSVLSAAKPIYAA